MAEPRWRSLPETLSFVLADVEPHGRTEALLSFWGEPFMSRATNRQVPRYIFRIQSHSDLIARLVELEREHRLGRQVSTDPQELHGINNIALCI